MSTRPPSKPRLSDIAVANLTADQQLTLVECLEAHSDWIAWSAANVLINVPEPALDSTRLFRKDMSSWPRDRGALLYIVAILTAGHVRERFLTEAATSDLTDYRVAARHVIALDAQLDSNAQIRQRLNRDDDFSIRPKTARDYEPRCTYWTCNDCRAENDLDVEDCPACETGTRPE